MHRFIRSIGNLFALGGLSLLPPSIAPAPYVRPYTAKRAQSAESIRFYLDRAAAKRARKAERLNALAATGAIGSK